MPIDGGGLIHSQKSRRKRKKEKKHGGEGTRRESGERIWPADVTAFADRDKKTLEFVTINLACLFF